MKIAICDDDRQDLLHIVSLVEAYRDTRKAELTYVCFQNATTDNIKKAPKIVLKKRRAPQIILKKRRAPEIVLNDNNIHRTFTIGFSLIFGVLLSVCFAGVERTRKNRAAVGCVCLILLLAQTLCWWFFGIETTSKLYSLIIHLPVFLFLTMYLKRPWLVSVVSILTAIFAVRCRDGSESFWAQSSTTDSLTIFATLQPFLSPIISFVNMWLTFYCN